MNDEYCEVIERIAIKYAKALEERIDKQKTLIAFR